MDRAQDGGREKDGRGSRRRQVRDGAGRARVLALWNERRVRRMIRVEELDSVRERIGTVDVAEGPAQREGGQEDQDEKAKERPLHGGA